MMYFRYIIGFNLEMSDRDSDSSKSSDSSSKSDSETSNSDTESDGSEWETNLNSSKGSDVMEFNDNMSGNKSTNSDGVDNNNDHNQSVSKERNVDIHLAPIFSRRRSHQRSRSRSPLNAHNEDLEVSLNVSNDVDTEGVTPEEAQHNRDQAARRTRSVLDSNKEDDVEFEWVGTRKKSNSDVWLHWGFKKYVNTAVNYDKVFCKICGSGIKYSGSSTNMRFHLNTKHPSWVGKKEDVTQPKASDYIGQPRKHKYPKSHPINKTTRDVLVKWFCKRDRPFLMAEDPEFQEFCQILDPKYELPSRTTVTKRMEEIYLVEKEKLTKKLERVDYLSGTNDGGSATNGQSFVTNTIHYVDPDTWTLEHATLGCTVMKKAHTAVNYREHVNNTEEQFSVKGKVKDYTTDNETKMHAAFKEDERNGCIAHIQSKTMEKAVKSVNTIRILRKKIVKVARLARFSKFKYALVEAQKNKNLPQRCVLQEVKTRFTSTLTMLHSVMSFDDENSKEETRKKAKLNIEAINTALAAVGTKKSKTLIISESDGEKVVATANVLQPICFMLTMLGGDKYVTGSIVLPYMKKVVSLLTVEDTDPQFIVELKSFIRKDFLQRCRENLNFDILRKATLFDPRYKSMKSIDPTQKEQLLVDIEIELEAMECPQKRKNDPVVDNIQTSKKKLKRLVLESDDESEYEDFTVKQELNKYLNDSKLAEESDPLTDYWKKKKDIYPRLANLAKRYLCVQATSTPSERVFSKMNNIVTKKRNRITPNHTNESIFLAGRL